MADLKASKEAKAIRVLHVDDDASLREIFKLILLDLDGGFEIDQACCVDEGLSKLSVGCYDVVVSDYEMPQKDGLQFLKELRKKKNDTPFILFTGRGREEVAIKALNLGADGYYNKQGNPETVYGEVAHGIIQLVLQNRLREKLFVEEERFRQLFSNTPMAVAIYKVINGGEDFVFKDINSAAERIEKIEKAAVLEKRVTDVFPGVKNFGLFEVFKRVSKTGKAEYFPDAIYQDGRDTGSWRENWVIKLPNDNIAAIYNDITERKKAETELKATFEVLERLGENIGAGLAVIGKDYRVVWANKRLMDLGVAPNKKCYQTFNRSETICIDCGAKKIFEQNAALDVHEFKTVNSKGEKTWVELRVTPLKDKEGKVTAALELAVPITERKKVLDALRASEERYKTYVENSPVAFFVANSEGKYEQVNEAACKLLGYDRNELLEMTISNILFEKDVSLGLKQFVSLKETGKTLFDVSLKRKDGKPVYVILNATKLPDGRLMAFCENISERKKSEEKLKENSQRIELMNEKLNVVGSLTRHDVGNKLMVANSNLFLLRKMIGDKPEFAKYFDGINSALESANKIFEFSRFYEQIGAEEPSKENVFDCFNQAAALLPNLGSVKVDNECGELVIMADSMLKQIFYNFIDNSLKHGEKVTQIRLHYSKEGEELKLFYEDDGVGVSETNKPKIFNSGFTTLGSSGLGLSLVKKMIEFYGWTITEEGEAGKGAKFVISIPLSLFSGS